MYLGNYLNKQIMTRKTSGMTYRLQILHDKWIPYISDEFEDGCAALRPSKQKIKAMKKRDNQIMNVSKLQTNATLFNKYVVQYY